MRVYQVPVHTRLWLATALITCSLPQLLLGPVWQSLLLGVVVAIRWLVDHQRMRLPGRIIRGGLLVAAVGMTWYSFGRIYGPEAGVALLVSLFSLKYLEMVRQRDAYVVIVLGYFVCATALLFERGPGMFLFVLLSMLLLTAALVGINHSETKARASSHIKTGSVLFLQAVPVTVVLFVLVPRVAPLWNMQLDSGKARTGMTDSISPGDISELSESSELAFRVAFEGALPPAAERYWRGLTLSHFDGRTWQQAIPRGGAVDSYLYNGRGAPPDWYQQLQAQGKPQSGYSYQLIMEPTQRRWLFAMAVPMLEEGEASLARDMRLVARAPVTQRTRYSITSFPDLRPAIVLDVLERELMLSLPGDSFGRRARTLADQWRRDSRTDNEIVSRALRHFREQPFHYTLKPPPLTTDPIDEFLFRTQRGFCEHYASSFTFLMRAAGVPARVVVGYQGGEQNTLGSHLLVRQYDAHAWTEVWLQGQGWVRVDPTGAVAPDRIALGLRASLRGDEEAQDTLEGLDSFASGGLLGRLQQWTDYVDFRWQTWVLGYDNASQLQLLRHWLGEASPLRIAASLVAAISVLLTLYMLILLRQAGTRRQTVLEREFWRVHQRVEQQVGHPLAQGLSPQALARVIDLKWPKAGPLVHQWAVYYQQMLYNPGFGAGKAQIRHLRRLRNRLYKLLD